MENVIGGGLMPREPKGEQVDLLRKFCRTVSNYERRVFFAFELRHKPYLDDHVYCFELWVNNTIIYQFQCAKGRDNAEDFDIVANRIAGDMMALWMEVGLRDLIEQNKAMTAFQESMRASSRDRDHLRELNDKVNDQIGVTMKARQQAKQQKDSDSALPGEYVLNPYERPSD